MPAEIAPNDSGFSPTLQNGVVPACRLRQVAAWSRGATQSLTLLQNLLINPDLHRVVGAYQRQKSMNRQHMTSLRDGSGKEMQLWGVHHAEDNASSVAVFLMPDGFVTERWSPADCVETICIVRGRLWQTVGDASILYEAEQHLVFGRHMLGTLRAEGEVMGYSCCVPTDASQPYPEVPPFLDIEDPRVEVC